MDNPLPSKVIVAARTTAFFTAACLLLFIAGMVVTIYYCVSMCCDMKMPGGWTMSMMWMRMSGDTWLTAWLSFTFMWMAMMTAMMMPSAAPVFVKTGWSAKSFCQTVLGYFTVWTLPVILLFPAGVLLAEATMQSQRLSRIVPLLSGMVLVAAGAFQFTRLKINYLMRCRSLSGCTGTPLQKTMPAFKHGCRHGFDCEIFCAGLMVAQLMLGVMNPLAMIGIAMFVTAEKLLPRPALVVKLVGIAIITAGITMMAGWAAAAYG